jgi:hypothetical protein
MSEWKGNSLAFNKVFPAVLANEDFFSSDLANIWLSLTSASMAVGQIVQNIKIYPSVPPDASSSLIFSPPDLGIGNYEFMPKSISFSVTTDAGVGNRFIILEKWLLGGFPSLKELQYSNQITPQVASELIRYSININSLTEQNYSNGGEVVRVLGFTESFNCYFQGALFESIVCQLEGHQGTDAWTDDLVQRIVCIGDVRKLE